MAKFTQDGAVELYYDNSKKFETTSTGANIVGNLDVINGHVFINDNFKVNVGTSSDLQIYHDGSNSRIENSTGQLKLKAMNSGTSVQMLGAGDETMVQAISNGAVELYHDNSKKFQTTSNGSEISTGHLQFTNVGWTGEHAGKIQHHANYLYFQGGSAGFQFRSSGGTDRLLIDGNGHLLPAANNTYDLGSTSKRWRNVYTNDLNLSNEGSSNDVDGTWGNYTIQEGAEDLFLINKRNGKKYKFNLTEVS